jgi:competence ComEA-like helix-hairpin-helix protein
MTDGPPSVPPPPARATPLLTRHRLYVAIALAVVCAVVALAWSSCDERPARRRSEPGQVEQRRLDLNRATVAELERLPGIGDKLAHSIIASRNARGGQFRSVEDLLQIDGIGEKTLANVRPYLYVTP